MSDALNRRVGASRLTSADEPFVLEQGGTVAPLVAAWETYGTLNAERSNAVLVCHALTGSAHAAGPDAQGRAGWWDGIIGPGRAVDTNRFFVICTNVLGGCYGTTGPHAVAPETGGIYGDTFPDITIRDMVHAQRLLLQRLGVDRLQVVLGGSMGGMQVLEWACSYPEHVGAIIPIATGAAHSPWAVAFNTVAREALALGAVAGDAGAGLQLARKVAMISYRSAEEFGARFGRSAGRGLHIEGSGEHEGEPGTFAVESWLEHHGQSLARRFDAATYAVLTRAMDRHDVGRGRTSQAAALAAFTGPALVLGISSDVLYPVHEQHELARLLPGGIYGRIDSPYGHDAFLIETEQLGAHITTFLAVIGSDKPAGIVDVLHTEYQYQDTP